MKICIVRHGSAVPGAVDDQDRTLTEKGAHQATQAGKWLKSQVFDRPACWASPYRRTLQTAENISVSTGYDIQSNTCLTPDREVSDVINQLQSSSSDVVLVSHLPLVGHIASYLIDGEIREQPWSPAECWVLEGDAPGPGCMSVVGVWYPALENNQ